MKNTVIIGASTNPARYSFMAAQKLTSFHHPIFLIGKGGGSIFGQEIHQDKVIWPDIDTVTLYINPSRQPEYYDYILSLNPQRVIFNPGTENPEFADILNDKNIVPVEACTLVLLSIGQY